MVTMTARRSTELSALIFVSYILQRESAGAVRCLVGSLPFLEVGKSPLEDRACKPRPEDGAGVRGGEGVREE